MPQHSFKNRIVNCLAAVSVPVSALTLGIGLRKSWETTLCLCWGWPGLELCSQARPGLQRCSNQLRVEHQPLV